MVRAKIMIVLLGNVLWFCFQNKMIHSCCLLLLLLLLGLIKINKNFALYFKDKTFQAIL